MANDLERYNSSLSGPEADAALRDMANHTSERYAKGTVNGSPVGGGQVGYQDNSKYYKERAEEAANRAESAVPIGTESAVLWTMAQSLTDSAKQVARANIGAPSGSSTVAGGKNLIDESTIGNKYRRYPSGDIETLPQYLGNTELYPVKAGQKISLSTVKVSSGQPWIAVSFYDVNGVYLSYVGSYSYYITTLAPQDGYMSFVLYKSGGAVYGVDYTNTQLEYGDKTAYEPFYKSTLQLTRAKNLINLLNPTFKSSTVSGVECIKNLDGTYTLNGTATANAYFVLKVINSFGRPIKYVGVPSPSSQVRIQCWENNTVMYSNDVGEGAITEIRDNTYFDVFVPSGVTCNNLVIKPMITTDFSATYDDYVSYSKFGDLLWVNASPSSAHGDVNYEIPSLLNYDKFLIVYRPNKDEDFSITTIATKGNFITPVTQQKTSPFVLCFAFGIIQDKIIRFITGKRTTAVNNWTSDNTCMIPCEIYGIK